MLERLGHLAYRLVTLIRGLLLVRDGTTGPEGDTMAKATAEINDRLPLVRVIVAQGHAVTRDGSDAIATGRFVANLTRAEALALAASICEAVADIDIAAGR